MLKIECSDKGKECITLRLEGRVIGPWVEEVRRLAEKILASGAILTFDLTEVIFVDRQGIELFRNLRERQATFLNGSVFVAEQLKAGEWQGR